METATEQAAPSGQAAAGPGGGGRPRIVVGIDGSAGSRAALVWALTAAVARGADVEALSVFPVDFYWTDPYLLDARRIDSIRADTEARVLAEVDEARRDPAVAQLPGAGALEVRVVIVPGPTAENLVHRAEGAELLVVGSRGRGAVRSTLVGSVALHCSAHATCPVVVVHPGTVTENRVVVGIDRSDASAAALRRAVHEAARLGAEVVAVAAYQPTNYWSDLYAVMAPPSGQTGDQAQRAAEKIVAEVLATPGLPDPTVRVVVEEGHPGDVLVRQSDGSALLVVGSRGRSQLQGVILGSVALSCVMHAHCPVMVVHPAPAGARADAGAVAAPAAG